MKRAGCLLLIISSILIIGCARDDDRLTNNDSVSNNSGSSSEPGLLFDSIVGENLLLNGGVEEWNRYGCEYPYNWLPPSGYCNKVTANYKYVFEGGFSAKMKALETGVSARMAQLVQITPGSKIRIHFVYYVEQWKTNGARTYCYFRTKGSESSSISISDLREIYTNDEYYIFRGGGYGKAFLPHELNTWLVFDETITVPQNATYFEFGINSYKGTIIYIDDCYVVEIVK